MKYWSYSLLLINCNFSLIAVVFFAVLSTAESFAPEKNKKQKNIPT